LDDLVQSLLEFVFELAVLAFQFVTLVALGPQLGLQLLAFLESLIHRTVNLGTQPLEIVLSIMQQTLKVLNLLLLTLDLSHQPVIGSLDALQTVNLGLETVDHLQIVN
jgi:hypothetical protein